MSASIILNYSFSILLNAKSKISVRGSLIGTISGAIMYGSIAGTCINIGAAIAVGLISGFFSALYYEKLYVKVNASNIRDSFGYLNFLVVSFIGTFVITPIVLKIYYNYSVNLPPLQPSNAASGYFLGNLDIAGWVLVYVGVSLGIGILSGLIIGLILRCL